MDDGAPARDERCVLPRAARLTDPDEIRALFRRGKRRKTRHLDVFVSTSPVARPRIAVVVAKPRGKTAVGPRGARGAGVQRNRLKRRLREIARIAVLPRMRERNCAVDILVRTRPEAYAASFAELRDELTGLESWMCSSAT